MIAPLFVFVSLALANNYCVEKTNGNCQKICQDAPLNFDGTFNHIPSNEELNSDSYTTHNIYVADDVDFLNSNQNFILCDPSIKLIYPTEVTELTISNEEIRVEYRYLKPNNVPILFHFNSTLIIQIGADKTSSTPSIMIEATKPNLFIKPRFLTENIKENVISITEKSEKINVYELTEDIQTAFSNTDKLIDKLKTYYCLSDHDEKCKDYSHLNPTYIKSITEVVKHPCYLIVETSLRQLYISEFQLRYTHIICLEGSDVTYRPQFSACHPRDFYAIMHSKYIEIAGMYFEGKGSLTVISAFYMGLHSTTQVNNFDFTLKSPEPFHDSDSAIDPLSYDRSALTINPKIKIDEMSIFCGSSLFTGLFEPDKYFSKYITSLNTPEEYVKYYYNDIIYYLRDGEHEITDSWTKPCHIGSYGTDHFLRVVFNNVNSFSGNKADFIYVNTNNNITIRPWKHLSLVEYPSTSHARFIIEVNGDVIVHKKKLSSSNHISDDKCQIKGSGTLRFLDLNHYNNITAHCEIDDTITAVFDNSVNKDVYLCIGQSSLEKCKSEIDNVDSIKNVDWIWQKNVNAIHNIDYYTKVFVTDEQYLSSYNQQEIILTAKSYLTIETNKLTVNKDSVNGIVAQKKSAKLRVNLIAERTFYYNYFYRKYPLKIQYNEDPTEIDLNIYLNYENILLSMNYPDTFQANTIKLSGRSVLNIRDSLKEVVKIFQPSESTIIQVSPDQDYADICYSDNFKQCSQFEDYVWAPNISEFIKYDSVSTKSKVTLFKDISLSMNSNFYVNSYFYCMDGITITCDLPNNAIIYMAYEGLGIITDKSYFFECDYSSKVKFIFDIKEKITFENQYNRGSISIEFKSSLKSFEIIPGHYVKSYSSNTPLISVPKDLAIYSPLSDNIKKIFNSDNIHKSTSWTYLYLSEDAKSLCTGNDCSPFSDFQDDENLPENIVLVVGSNDVLKIPKNWVKQHNVYLLTSGSVYQDITINDVVVITYLSDGILLNENFKIISGNLNIKVPQVFTINANLSTGYEIQQYLYAAKLDITQNTKTNAHIGSLISNQNKMKTKVINFNGMSETNTLTILLKDESDLYEFNILNDYQTNYNSYANNDFGYDNICYCPAKDIEYYCSGKFYHASDITSFLASVKGNPGKQANLNMDLIIPFPTGEHYILNPSNENIKIELPDHPSLFSIHENDKIQVTYKDSTLIDILSKCTIKVGLKDSITFDIKSSTKSSIIFSLESDVFISSESEFLANFNFDLINNSFSFLTDDLDKYKDIFGDTIKEYISVCAYQVNSDSCSFKYKKLISDVFKVPVDFHELEIAPITNPIEITLPSIFNTIKAYILPKSTSTLTINDVKSLQINSESIIVNEFWEFTGDRNILSFKLNTDSSLSISDENNARLSLLLTNSLSSIDLRKCVPQESKQISIHKYGQEANELTIYGSSDIYRNFKNHLISYDGIRLISNSSQKYICICNNNELCVKCKEDTEGFVTETNKITSDPGENVDIRIFSDIETSSNVFSNEHNVYVDMNCKLNITDVQSVDQTIDDKIKVDHLIFNNSSNILLKPRDPSFDITMQKIYSGLSFTIEMDTFLKLNVVNSNEKDLNASELFVKGWGELNIFDYPFHKIIANRSISVIKGVYTICNSQAGNSYCSYDSAGYKLLENRYDFVEDFDPNSKIVVFLDSFTHGFDVNIHHFSGQKIQFMRNPNSLHLLEKQNKLRFLSTTELLSKQDSTMELAGSEGGAKLETSDSDLFIVGFYENLTLKQEGKASANMSMITIQPLCERGTVYVDDSFDIGKQKVKIEIEEDKKISLFIVFNESVSSKEQIQDSIEFDSEKISVNIVDKEEYNNNNNIKPKSQKKHLSKGGIAGIVIAVLVVVGAAAVITIFLLKKKRKVTNDLTEISNDTSDNNSKSEEP